MTAARATPSTSTSASASASASDDDAARKAKLHELEPFGLEVRFPAGTRWESIDPDLVHAWVRTHRVVVLRGIVAFTKAEMPLQARRLGPLQVWPFGAINELVPDKKAKNYLYTDRSVPLHWDGAFAGRTPRYLFFHCVSAVEATVEGGETVFVDTTRVWEKASEPTRDRWRSLVISYETERIVHYGGSFSARVVAQHAISGETVLRFAEPVDDLNPVHVSINGLSPIESAAMITELRAAMQQPDAVLAHRWEPGDIVVADNHALLHGRRAFQGGETRHIRRVNIHDPEERTFWKSTLRDSLRIRRPEFMVAEIPILVIATLLARRFGIDDTPFSWARFTELGVLFFLLFHFGDLINCYCDRDLDAVYKTHLSEAVYGLGVRNVRAQIVATIALALGLGAHLALTTGRSDIVFLVLAGIVLGGAYSIPPVRLKGRGILQVLALWAVIFVGPMLLVVRTLSPDDRIALLPFDALLLIGAYGAMQQGTILVNTAEDLSEDIAAGITTSAVQLGLRGILGLATTMVALGGAGVVYVLAGWSPSPSFVALAPLACAWCWVTWEIGSAWRDASTANSQDAALAKLRPRARRMPLWITATAWATLFGTSWLTVVR